MKIASLLVLLVVVLALSSCSESTGPDEGSQWNETVVFFDEFSGGLSNWSLVDPAGGFRVHTTTYYNPNKVLLFKQDNWGTEIEGTATLANDLYIPTLHDDVEDRIRLSFGLDSGGNGQNNCRFKLQIAVRPNGSWSTLLDVYDPDSGNDLQHIMDSPKIIDLSGWAGETVGLRLACWISAHGAPAPWVAVDGVRIAREYFE